MHKCYQIQTVILETLSWYAVGHESLSSSMWNMYFALRVFFTSVAFYLRSLFWLEVCNLNSDIYCIMYILLHSTLIGATAILKHGFVVVNT